MPPKNSIRLDPGKMYYNTPEGPIPLGEVQSVTLEPVEDEFDYKGDTLPRIVKPTPEYTASIELTAEASEALRNLTATAEAAMRVFKRALEIVKDIMDACPNRRVVHLALHGSPRVRKKNVKRLVRMYKKMRKD